jgi:hypothetical protein
MKKLLLHRLCAILLLQLIYLGVSAQTRQLTGTVTSSSTGLPLEGATVGVKGSNDAATTDGAGNFKISVPATAKQLTVSYIGYALQEVTIPSSGSVSIKLDLTAAASLDEVIVVGYGTQRKSVVTGAISSIRASDLDNQPVIPVVEQALQGRTSGLTISSTSGQPGASSLLLG